MILAAQVPFEVSRALNAELEALRLRVFSQADKDKAKNSVKAKALRKKYGLAIKAMRDFAEWAITAKPGERMAYAVLPCLLMEARLYDLGLDHLAKLAFTLHTKGYIVLFGTGKPGARNYHAARSKLGFVPAEAMHGTVGNTPSAKDLEFITSKDGTLMRKRKSTGENGIADQGLGR